MFIIFIVVVVEPLNQHFDKFQTFEDVTQLVEYHQQCDILLLQEKAKVKLRNTPRKT